MVRIAVAVAIVVLGFLSCCSCFYFLLFLFLSFCVLPEFSKEKSYIFFFTIFRSFQPGYMKNDHVAMTWILTHLLIQILWAWPNRNNTSACYLLCFSIAYVGSEPPSHKTQIRSEGPENQGVEYLDGTPSEIKKKRRLRSIGGRAKGARQVAGRRRSTEPCHPHRPARLA